jgi:Bor protein
MRAGALAIALCLALPACWRTTYVNLLPPAMPPAVETDQTVVKQTPSGWQSFFVWGLIPTEKVIDAAKLCGGEEHVARIETRQSILEGLIQSVAGYYINVYAPYNGHVVCDHSVPR